MNGWHHFESLGICKVDRRMMYVTLGDGYFRDLRASRYLGVATSLLACYTAKYYFASQGRSRGILDRMLTFELLQNSVLSFSGRPMLMCRTTIFPTIDTIVTGARIRDDSSDFLGRCMSSCRVTIILSSSSMTQGTMPRVDCWS